MLTTGSLRSLLARHLDEAKGATSYLSDNRCIVLPFRALNETRDTKSANKRFPLAIRWTRSKTAVNRDKRFYQDAVEL